MDSSEEKITKILNTVEKIVTEIASFKLELTEVKKEMTSMKDNMHQITKSQELHDTQFAAHKSTQDKILKEHTALSKINHELYDQVKALEDSITKEKIARNNIENNKRKQNVEISGIPFTRGEDCKKIVFNLAKALGSNDIEMDHIDVAHRLRTDRNSTKIPVIIVLFNTRSNRDNFFDLPFSAKMRNLTIQDLHLAATPETERMHNKIYINESLSVDTKILFRKSRDWATTHKFNSCYTSGGNIFIKREKTSQQRHRISCEGDLLKLNI